jgi:hypothetical protein
VDCEGELNRAGAVALGVSLRGADNFKMSTKSENFQNFGQIILCQNRAQTNAFEVLDSKIRKLLTLAPFCQLQKT